MKLILITCYKRQYNIASRSRYFHTPQLTSQNRHFAPHIREMANSRSESEKELFYAVSKVKWVFSKAEIFFSPNRWYRLHVTGVFGTKTVEILENRVLSYSLRRFSNTMMSYLRFCTYDLKTLRVNADFFNKRRKKISVFENTWLRVDKQIRFENATFGRSLKAS